MIKIITNNPAVAEGYPGLTQYQDGDVYGVFVAVRDVVHLGGRLISHPLSGSIKPNESPYKSVAVLLEMRKGLKQSPIQTDTKSLQVIEDAIAVLRRMPKKSREYTPAMLEDFRVIDLDLIENVVR